MESGTLGHCLNYLAEAANHERVAVPQWGGADVGNLPAPARRYFEFALPPFSPLILRAELSWVGGFRARPGGGWMPFTAQQSYTTAPRGFEWKARVGRFPLFRLSVRDRYEDGTGSVAVRWAGIPLMSRGGTRETGAASLLRFLAESVWLPTALLPSPDCRWEAIDAGRARVTLTDCGLTVSMTVNVDEGGRITTVRAERFRDVRGAGVLTPWVGRFGEYKSVAGMMVPAHAEVEWELPEGPMPYWKGALGRADYEFWPTRP